MKNQARDGRIVLRVTLNNFNLSNAELNPICHLLALLGAHPIFHISRIRVKQLGWHLNFSAWFMKNSECYLNSKR
jgi:hypothetical protein